MPKANPHTDKRRTFFGKMEAEPAWFLILHISLIINSLAGVASKMAGRHAFLSAGFCFYYGLVLLITFTFALIWQQVLRHMSLTFAFSNKPITVIYMLFWGWLIFGENVTPKKIIGSLVILTGIIVGVSGHERS